MAAPPPGYSAGSMIPSTGGTIHPMHGGGSGGLIPTEPNSTLLEYTNPRIPIIGAAGGGDPTLVAVGATATKIVNNTATKTTTAPNTQVNNPTLVAVAGVATKEVNGATNGANTSTKSMTDTSATVSTAKTDAFLEKQISLNGRKITIKPPWDLKDPKQIEALAWFGVDKTSDTELQQEVLQALYDGVCNTDKPLIMVLQCEPIRRLIQSLAEKLLGNLTHPVSKITSKANVAKQLQTATLMTFNVFKNQCTTKTAKQYIETINADIVCTQKDTNIEFANYKKITACGTDDDTQYVYLKNGIPSASSSECITMGDHSAVLFIYQDVVIVNMGSADPKLLEEVLNKRPHIILGSFDGSSLLDKGYVQATSKNPELNTTDAIWYKQEQDIFELKHTTIHNIAVKLDPSADPSTCSYSDHNPIITKIHFKNTVSQSAKDADAAAVIANKALADAVAKDSRLLDAVTSSSTGSSHSITTSSTKIPGVTTDAIGTAITPALPGAKVGAQTEAGTATNPALAVAKVDAHSGVDATETATNLALQSTGADTTTGSETVITEVPSTSESADPTTLEESSVDGAVVQLSIINDNEMVKKIAVAAVAVMLQGLEEERNRAIQELASIDESPDSLHNTSVYKEIISKSSPGYKEIIEKGDDPTITDIINILDKADRIQRTIAKHKYNNAFNQKMVELHNQSIQLKEELIKYVEMPPPNPYVRMTAMPNNSLTLMKTLKTMTTKLTSVTKNMNLIRGKRERGAVGSNGANTGSNAVHTDPTGLATGSNGTTTELATSSSVANTDSRSSGVIATKASADPSQLSFEDQLAMINDDLQNNPSTSSKKNSRVQPIVQPSIAKHDIGNGNSNANSNANSTSATMPQATVARRRQQIKPLNQFVRAQGINISRPRVTNVQPEQDVVAQPVARRISEPKNAINNLLRNHKPFKPRSTKPVPITQYYSTNNDNFESRIDTLLSDIERTENDAGMSLNSKEYTGPTIGYINRQLEILKKYKPMIEQLKVNIKLAPSIPSLSSDITEYERICNDAIRIIRENLTLTSNISASELADFSNGGKRKQKKRRTQKKRKQKKRFGTQKK